MHFMYVVYVMHFMYSSTRPTRQQKVGAANIGLQLHELRAVLDFKPDHAVERARFALARLAEAPAHPPPAMTTSAS